MFVAGASAKTAGFAEPNALALSKWRATVDENGQYCFAVAL
jgi:hypothetical protein